MHNLDIQGAKVAFAARGKPGWHLLGETFPEDEHVTTADMLRRAYLAGWGIFLRPVETDARAVIPAFEVIRTNPFDGKLDRLGIVGKRYTVYQNEQLFAAADAILDGGGRWETAGAIAGGTRVFGTMTIDKEFVIDPLGASDTVKTYLLGYSSHDGSSNITFAPTKVRVVCENTLDWALSKLQQTYKIRHTRGAEVAVQDAREALNLAFKHNDALEAEAQEFYQTPMSLGQFTQVATMLYPKPEKDASKNAVTRWGNQQDLLASMFVGNANSIVDNAPNTVENIRNTAWAGLNVLTERLDWYRSGRGDNKLENLVGAQMGFDPTVQTEKNRIHSAIAEWVQENKKVTVAVK